MCNNSNVHSLKVAFPPLAEQERIVAITSTWDKAIALTERRIEAAQQHKKALMQRLLTGQMRFRGFEGKTWREAQLGEFLTMSLRKVPKPSISYSALGVRSHGKGTFRKEVEDPDKVSMSHLYRVKAGDLIVNITFAWEGAIALVKESDEGRLVSHRFPTYVFDREKVDGMKVEPFQPHSKRKIGKCSYSIERLLPSTPIDLRSIRMIKRIRPGEYLQAGLLCHIAR